MHWESALLRTGGNQPGMMPSRWSLAVVLFVGLLCYGVNQELPAFGVDYSGEVRLTQATTASRYLSRCNLSAAVTGGTRCTGTGLTAFWCRPHIMGFRALRAPAPAATSFQAQLHTPCRGQLELRLEWP